MLKPVAPILPSPPALHMREFEFVLPSWYYRSIHLMDLCNTNSWLSGMVRLVCNCKDAWSEKGFLVSRSFEAATAFDGGSYGFCHFAAPYSAAILRRLASSSIGVDMFGARGADILADGLWEQYLADCLRINIESVPSAIRGYRGTFLDCTRFVAYGFYWYGLDVSSVQIQLQYWFDKFEARALRAIDRLGWTGEVQGAQGGRMVAAMIRLANSGNLPGRYILDYEGTILEKLARYFAHDYGHLDRWLDIEGTSAFAGGYYKPDIFNDLNYKARPVRGDGTQYAKSKIEKLA